MHTEIRIIKNTISLFGSSLITKLMGVALVAYLARVLTPEGFGILAFAGVISDYFNRFSEMGLPILATREIPRFKNYNLKYYVKNIITLRSYLGILSYILYFPSIFIFAQDTVTRNLLLIYGFTIIFNIFTLDWFFRGIEKMEYEGIFRILQQIILIAPVFIFIKDKKGILLTGVFQVVSMAFFCIAFIFLYFHYRANTSPQENYYYGEKLLRKGFPLWTASIMIIMINNADTIMLGLMRSKDEVGYYNASYKIIWLLSTFTGAFWNSTFPVISKYYKESKDKLQKATILIARLAVALAVPITFGGILLAKSLITFLYGQNYSPSILPFRILLLQFLLTTSIGAFSLGLLSCDRQIDFNKIIVRQVILNIGLNFFLIPKFGIVGASVSTIAAEALGFFLYFLAFNKIVKVPINVFSLKPILSAAIMGFVVWNIHNLHVTIIILIGGLSYAISFFLLGGLNQNEKDILIQILKRGKLVQTP